MALGEVLSRLRLDQVDVADALDVSRTTVGNWVHGRSVPQGTNLIRLLDYLRPFDPGLQVEDLVSAPVTSATEAQS